MKIADLFCGAGLFSAGFVSEGFEPVFAADINKDAVASYCQNIKPVARVHDVTIIPNDIKADVLLAGPPCQGFSTLGRRDPFDIRNDMALVVPRWAEALNAKVVIVENVPPFLKSKQWENMVNDFQNMGYKITKWVLDAAHFGTPQHRKRAFTIATKYSVPRKPKERDVIPSTSVFIEPIKINDPLHVWPVHTGVAYERIKNVPENGSKMDLLEHTPHLCPSSWFKLGRQATDVWGRINPHKPVNTVRCSFQSPSKGRYLHPSEDRVISLREGARLQGIPDKWSFAGSRTSIARQIGNGVPIPLANTIAKAIAKTLC